MEDPSSDYARMKSLITNIEGTPQIEIKEYLACKKINDNPTPINNKRVTIKVPNNEVKKGGWFSPDYSLFDIEMEVHSG